MSGSPPKRCVSGVRSSYLPIALLTKLFALVKNSCICLQLHIKWIKVGLGREHLGQTFDVVEWVLGVWSLKYAE